MKESQMEKFYHGLMQNIVVDDRRVLSFIGKILDDVKMLGFDNTEFLAIVIGLGVECAKELALYFMKFHIPEKDAVHFMGYVLNKSVQETFKDQFINNNQQTNEREDIL